MRARATTRTTVAALLMLMLPLPLLAGAHSAAVAPVQAATAGVELLADEQPVRGLALMDAHLEAAELVRAARRRHQRLRRQAEGVQSTVEENGRGSADAPTVPGACTNTHDCTCLVVILQLLPVHRAWLTRPTRNQTPNTQT